MNEEETKFGSAADPVCIYVHHSNGVRPNYKIPKKIHTIDSTPSTSMISQATGPKRHQIAPIEMKVEERQIKPQTPREKPKLEKRKRTGPRAPLDNILGEMDRSEKKRKLERVKTEIETSPVQNSILEDGIHLSREWLETRTPDDKIVNEFLSRDTIMEYLLGTKMSNGRIEPWNVMGFEKKNADDSRYYPKGYFRPSQRSPMETPYENRPKAKGPKTPPGSPSMAPAPGPSTSSEDPEQKNQGIFEQLAAISGTTSEDVAAFFSSDTWRDLVRNKAEELKPKNRRVEETKPQVQEQKPPPPPRTEEPKPRLPLRVANDESVKMELVSETSLSRSESPLPPPPPPPVILHGEECPPPPPPPLPDVHQPPPTWPLPPPGPRPHPPPPIHKPPPPLVLPPVRIQPNRVIPPPVGPPQPLMSIPTPLTAPPPPVEEPVGIALPPAPVESRPPPWMNSQMQNWSDVGDWSQQDEWEAPAPPPPQFVPPPPKNPPGTDVITKNLMNALGLAGIGGVLSAGPSFNASSATGPSPVNLPKSIPPPKPAVLGPPPSGLRRGGPAPRRGGRPGPPPGPRRGGFNGNPPPPPHPMPLLNVPPLPGPPPPPQRQHFRNMGPPPMRPPRRRGGAGGRPLKM